MENQNTPKDYTKYAFREDTMLDVAPAFLDAIYSFLNSIIVTDGMGSRLLTEPRFEYIHAETGKPAKKNTSKKKLDEEYRKIFSVEKTLKGEPVQHLTEAGKQALALMREIDQVRINNVDAGKGELRETLLQEQRDMQAAMNKPAPQPEAEAPQQPEATEQVEGDATMSVVKD